MTTYNITYSLHGSVLNRDTQSKCLRDATVNAVINLTHRPSLRGASIVSIKEVV